MNKEYEFQNYLGFIKENYPQSAFLKHEDGLVKKLFITIHDSLVISDIYSSITSLPTPCINLIEDQKLIYFKLLYIIPINDDFQFYSIMRANVENLLRVLLVPFKSDLNYQEIKETSFSTLNNLLDSTYLNQKYKNELSDLYSYFGTFSKNIHKISNEKNTFLYLKEMMNKPLTNNSIEKKITSLEKISIILVNIFIDIYKLKSNSLDTAQLSRLHSILGEEGYAELPLFK